MVIILIYLILWFVYYQLFKSILITINFSIYIPLFEFFLLLVFLHYYKYKKFTKFNIYVVKISLRKQSNNTSYDNNNNFNDNEFDNINELILNMILKKLYN